MVRTFTLINSNSEEWTFTDRSFRTFLNNPQGLGLSRSLTTSRYGNRQTVTGIQENFPQISGDLLFYDSTNSDRYTKYNQFARFISHEPLTLEYTTDVGTFTVDCAVTTLTKTETKTDKILTCPIQIQGLSLWKGQEIIEEGTNTFTLTNDGDFPCGFEIEIEGSLTNPYILLEQDEELYGEAKFDSETAFNNVYLNSNDGEQNVILKQNDSILPNPLSYQDLSISNGSIYVTFVKLARGESTLTIGSESGSVTSAKINYKPLYRSV